MKEIGIQFSAPMVRALLAGTKTVTRRTVKGEIPPDAVRAVFEPVKVGGKPAWRWLDRLGGPLGKPIRCPYGVAGDRLWVREAWRTTGDDGRADSMPPRDLQPSSVWYVADGAPPADELAGKVRPGMFMPRWASRILLEVTEVRCERLSACTEAEAIAEGIEARGRYWRDYLDVNAGGVWSKPISSYRSLWDSINGPGAWDADPWVFAVSFRRIEP